MRECLFRKSMVIAIILLFIGMCVIPSTGLILDKESHIPTTTSNKSEDFIKSKNLLEILRMPFPGVYTFFICSIDISGEGTVELEKFGPFSMVYWELSSGQIKINKFNVEYKESDRLKISGTLVIFRGSISENPLNITGRAPWAIFVELSELADIESDKERYNKGEKIDIITTNIDENTIIIENPSFTINLNSGFGRFREIFSKSFDNSIELEPGENFTWSWDQKDVNGNQVSFGGYIVAGDFTIQGIDRTHNVFTEFIINL